MPSRISSRPKLFNSYRKAIIDQELSLYYVATDIAQTYHGMMIAIPEDEWRVFSRMRPVEMVATLRELAQKVSLKADVWTHFVT